MKKILFIAAITCTAFFAAAQQVNHSISYSLGANLLFPEHNFYQAGFGIGVSGEAEYKASKKWGITGSVGIFKYKSKQYGTYVDRVLYSTESISVTQIPILLGANYYLNKFLYASGQLGVSVFNHNGSNFYDKLIYSGTSFTSAVGLGAKLANHVDVAINYLLPVKSGFTLTSTCIKLAYIF